MPVLSEAEGLSSASRAHNLGRYLQAKGFICVFSGVPGMAVDLEKIEEYRPAIAGRVIESVGEVDKLAQWLGPVKVSFELRDATASAFFDLFSSQGFGPDVPWRLFVGLVDGRPVTASRLFCAAGVAGIYHVATAPEARGRGFGTAMALAACAPGRSVAAALAS